ncbi:hypothetical protein SAMN03080598_00462 [Algoriphagus boritolerans DSM 17298 = JCM 18970]|uniref:Uncharacterized protein n=1 Tax=Algoriphagus boritolerans DSM 17298 = JCM 18970 TaxID=1120964 RepID=A0A1H5SST0_9BACT|nr:hypothetical protein SAMN03080598_00462 [Algoriphagus boritolerans DSM 17298 = JCM 18970]
MVNLRIQIIYPFLIELQGITVIWHSLDFKGDLNFLQSDF